MNFNFHSEKVEIINSFTGKTVCNKYSRLTKQNMFRRFGRIAAHLPGIMNRPIDRDYCEEKAAAIDYQVRFIVETVVSLASSEPFRVVKLNCDPAKV